MFDHYSRIFYRALLENTFLTPTMQSTSVPCFICLSCLTAILFHIRPVRSRLQICAIFGRCTSFDHRTIFDRCIATAGAECGGGTDFI